MPEQAEEASPAYSVGGDEGTRGRASRTSVDLRWRGSGPCDPEGSRQQIC